MNANIEVTKEICELEVNKREVEKIFYKLIKRVADIIVALFGCVLLVPLTILIFGLKCVSNDKGPIFMVQKRIGKNGKPFKMYKYRSMVKEADKILKQYLLNNPEKNQEFIKYRKLEEDPRITKVGKFIRKTSLDEFPQFINILKGDMSLVGPRPYLFREKRAIKTIYLDIIKVKPGLTGPWQIAGRSERTLEERMELDKKYIYESCLKNDIRYFFLTFKKVLKKEGAI